MTDLYGIPVYGSALIPRGQVIVVNNGKALYFHERISARGRFRRAHGRSRPAPRRLKVRYVKVSELENIFKSDEWKGGDAMRVRNRLQSAESRKESTLSR
jgi:hypothetical protein